MYANVHNYIIKQGNEAKNFNVTFLSSSLILYVLIYLEFESPLLTFHLRRACMKQEVKYTHSFFVDS